LVDKRERVWVVDRRNDRIQIFNTKGEFLSQWTGISYPTGIFIDDEETVYVSQIGRQVNIFTNDGKRLARWGVSRLLTYQGEDKETALFYAPHAIAVDSRGDLYVGEVPMGEFGVDRGSRTVQKFARRT
jgi:DNA-binding beta-propeller fold protein YncE